MKTSQADSGGHIVAFLSGLPNYGPHAVKQRGEALGTDNLKEHAAFGARDQAWKSLGEEMAERGIGVSLFAFSRQTCDLATIGMEVRNRNGFMLT